MSSTDHQQDPEYREIAEFALDVASRAGERIKALRDTRAVREWTKNGGRELVTSADRASDELIRETTARATPPSPVCLRGG